MRKYILVIAFFVVGYMGTTLFLTGIMDHNYQTEQTKTFKVECKSFDFDGEVYRDGKKFYELIGGKEIWIPLGDCLLREVD